MLSRIRPRLTSYEIVCAMARRAPIKAYFELDAQPAPIIEYTARLEMARINKTPMLILTAGVGRGRGAHRSSASVSASMGARRKSSGEEVKGQRASLVKSLSPSAIGCSMP